ncbi:hypothetical protein [Sphingomonas elodea]|uniref:hypothetical protein n=1 Tax=Sphingomonas elodea TaxID=179878 RepID=UPI00026321CB|nr:hypothetical protein [Sphingomonas elodea]
MITNQQEGLMADNPVADAIKAAIDDGALRGINGGVAGEGDAIGRVEALADSLAETARRFEAALDYQRSQTLSIRLDAKGKPRWFRPNGTIMSRRELEDYYRALNGPIRPRHERLRKIATALRVLASLGAYNAR